LQVQRVMDTSCLPVTTCESVNFIINIHAYLQEWLFGYFRRRARRFSLHRAQDGVAGW
jgi:hypothetical protein